MSIKQTRVWQFFCSIKLVIWLLAIIAGTSLVGTLIPQEQVNVYFFPWFIFLLILYAIYLHTRLKKSVEGKRRSLVIGSGIPGNAFYLFWCKLFIIRIT